MAVPIAHINLLDIDLAIAEAERARKDGASSSVPVRRAATAGSAIQVGRFWDAIDLAIAFRRRPRERQSSSLSEERRRQTHRRADLHHSRSEVMMAFSQMRNDGIFAEHRG